MVRLIVKFNLTACLLLATSADATQCDLIPAKFAKAQAASIRAPDLCFDGQTCMPGGIQASSFWSNSGDSKSIQNELLEYSNWRGQITTLPIPNEAGSLVRIARRVGTASCIRDTYLHEENGRHTVIHTESLDNLSAEASYCGNDAVEMLVDEQGVLIVVSDRSALVAHRLSRSFELQRVCSILAQPNKPKASPLKASKIH